MDVCRRFVVPVSVASYQESLKRRVCSLCSLYSILCLDARRIYMPDDSFRILRHSLRREYPFSSSLACVRSFMHRFDRLCFRRYDKPCGQLPFLHYTGTNACAGDSYNKYGLASIRSVGADAFLPFAFAGIHERQVAFHTFAVCCGFDRHHNGIASSCDKPWCMGFGSFFGCYMPACYCTFAMGRRRPIAKVPAER